MRDPLADELRRYADEAGLSAERLAPALLGVKAVFDTDLPNDPRFTGPVTRWLDTLIEVGAEEAVRRAVEH